MDIKTRIQELCKKNNITSKSLEMEIGVASGYISKIGKESKSPSTETLGKIAKRFNVTVDYLLTGKERSPIEEANLDLRISNDEILKNVIEKYYNLDAKKQKLILELIDLFSEE